MAATLPSTALSRQLLLHRRPRPGSQLLPSHALTAASPSINLKTAWSSINLKMPWSSPGPTGVRFHTERRPRRAFCIGGSDGPPLSSPSDLVHGFYSSVNGKDMKRLRELLSEDCLLEDLAFSKPFQGRKEVMRFFERLTGATGKHVMFVPESVYEVKEATAAAVWHMEWNGQRVPFTRGCSFYEFFPDGERLLIRKALVIVESPIKPGVLAVELLKIITSIFDKFPNLAEKFLQKPYAIIQLIMKIYKLFVEPLILPFLLYYMHLWKHLLQTMRSLLNFLVRILKMFM